MTLFYPARNSHLEIAAWATQFCYASVEILGFIPHSGEFEIWFQDERDLIRFKLEWM